MRHKFKLANGTFILLHIHDISHQACKKICGKLKAIRKHPIVLKTQKQYAAVPNDIILHQCIRLEQPRPRQLLPTQSAQAPSSKIQSNNTIQP